MKKNYIDFICSLHGYLIRIKEIHWNTETNSEHLLCDEIQDDVMESEDKFAECCMGMEGKHFQIGDLMPLLPNSTRLIPMLKELEDDVLDMRKDAEDDKSSGLVNILDDMMEFINKYKYRATQK